MPTNPKSPAPQSSTLVFGAFSDRWAWRVEWVDANRRVQTKDFPQRDLHPGEAKAAALAFQEDLASQAAA